jgi:hypothetical protein
MVMLDVSGMQISMVTISEAARKNPLKVKLPLKHTVCPAPMRKVFDRLADVTVTSQLSQVNIGHHSLESCPKVRLTTANSKSKKRQLLFLLPIKNPEKFRTIHYNKFKHITSKNNIYKYLNFLLYENKIKILQSSGKPGHFIFSMSQTDKSKGVTILQFQLVKMCNYGKSQS